MNLRNNSRNIINFFKKLMSAPQKRTKKIAVFDIDGTIFRSSLLIVLINGLVADGIFPLKAQKELEKDYLAWLDRRGTYDQYLTQVVNIYFRHIVDCKVRDVNRIVKKVIAWEKDRVYVFTRDLVKKLKREGYFLLAISGSPDYIVSHFARYIGFHAYYGSMFEVKNGRFTGRAINRDSWSNKRKVLDQFLKTAPFHVDLKRSIAVGDSPGDISMLEMVGRPIVFNPDNILARHAVKKKWKIVVERKNVIYDIRAHRFLNNHH
ncbi:MAG: HAD family phosphatase [Candidatus Yonathbacteria bacterium]|nr:HAD family phosphatase [Candidatus Yonathbacteria bacterium]